MTKITGSGLYVFPLQHPRKALISTVFCFSRETRDLFGYYFLYHLRNWWIFKNFVPFLLITHFFINVYILSFDLKNLRKIRIFGYFPGVYKPFLGCYIYDLCTVSNQPRKHILAEGIFHLKRPKLSENRKN